MADWDFLNSTPDQHKAEDPKRPTNENLSDVIRELLTSCHPAYRCREACTKSLFPRSAGYGPRPWLEGKACVR